MNKITISDILTLRTLRYSDASSLTKNANNFNIWKNLTDNFPHPYTIQDALDFISIQKDITPPKVFAIEFHGSVIGAIRLAVDKDNTELCGDIGYWIGEVYWNRGIVTEVIKGIVNYGFKTYPTISCISAYVFTSNFASLRVLEKVGFKHNKTLKKSIPKAEKKMDVHYYIILREDIQ